MAKTDDRQVRCNFCGKKQNEVNRLIAGTGAFICDECISLCAGIIDASNSEMSSEAAARAAIMEGDLPKPTEIKAFLDEYVIGQDSA